MNERTFARLVAEIKGEDFAKVQEAADSICALCDAGVLPLIFRALEAEPPLVQRVMLWALRNYKHSDYSRFLPFLMSPDEDVREAAQVLFMEGGLPAAAALEGSFTSPDVSVWYAAVAALDHFHSEEATGPLLRAAGLADAQVRAAALRALFVYGSDEVTTTLIAALSDVSPVRLAALCGLKGRRLSPEQLAQVWPLMDDSDAEVRAAAVYVVDAAVPANMAEDDDWLVRRAVAEVTTDFRRLEFLCMDEEATVRIAATDAACRRGLVIEDLMLELLYDEVPGVRRAAAAALGNGAGATVVAALAGALKDQKPGVRAAAAMSLGKIGGAAAVEALEGAVGVNNPILAGIVRNALTAARR